MGITKEERERRNALANKGLKNCTGCKEDKPLDQFYKAAKKKDGLTWRCKECQSKYYQDNREKILARSKQYREANPDYLKQWRAKNADHVKSNYRQRAYRLTQEQYDQMLKDQNYVCAICREEEKNGKSLAVDHDHSCCKGNKSCGECVRQLLCDHCNRMLGYARDNIETLKAAQNYLERHSIGA